MNIGSGEAADQMVRMMLTGGEVTVKLSASALKNLAAITVALAKDHKTLSGKIQMRRMLRETRDLRLFPMSPKELKAFQKEAKHQKLLYATIKDKRTGQIDVVLPTTDLERANRVFDRMLYRGAGAQQKGSQKSAPEQERTPKKGTRSERDSHDTRDNSSSVRSAGSKRMTTEKRTSVDARLRAYRESLNRQKSAPARKKAKAKTAAKTR